MAANDTVTSFRDLIQAKSRELFGEGHEDMKEATGFRRGARWALSISVKGLPPQHRPGIDRLVAYGFKAGMTMAEIAKATNIERDYIEEMVRRWMR